jgi:hypothetical protein
MIPRILEYEDGIVKMTAEAYVIPEFKAIVEKFPLDYTPYLAYVHGIAAPDSQYANIPIEERSEAIIYDIQQTLGEFDFTDETVKKAIEKMRTLYASRIVKLAEQLEEEIDEWRLLLKNERAVMGEGGNMKDRMAIMANIDKYAANVAKVRKQADEEIKGNMKGDQEMGDY